jgi:hypothetical protein
MDPGFLDIGYPTLTVQAHPSMTSLSGKYSRFSPLRTLGLKNVVLI